MRSHRGFQRVEIAGDRIDIVAEQFAERTIDVEVDLRSVIGVADLADPPDDPLRIGD